MKVYNWDLNGFETAYNKYYYMESLNNCDGDGHDEDGHFHDTLRECGKASCICAFEDELITYSRLFFESNPIFKHRADNIIKLLNLPIGSTVLVAGCAFGHLLEELSERKMYPYGFDNSEYIQFNIDTEAKFPIHNIDILDTNFVNLIRESTGVMYFDCIITEDLLPTYNNVDNSYNKIFTNLELLLKPNKPLTNIIHIIDENSGHPLIEMNLDLWKEFNPTHRWLNYYGE